MWCRPYTVNGTLSRPPSALTSETNGRPGTFEVARPIDVALCSETQGGSLVDVLGALIVRMQLFPGLIAFSLSGLGFFSVPGSSGNRLTREGRKGEPKRNTEFRVYFQGRHGRTHIPV